MFGKSTRTTRLVAVTTLLLGLVWVWATLINPLLHPIAPTDGSGARPILIVMLLVLSLPGFFCVYFGVDLLRQVRTGSIKGALGSLLAAFVIWLISALVGMLPGERREMLFCVALLAGTLLALPAYAAGCKALLRREGFVAPETRAFLGKIVVLLVALQIWYFGSLLVTTYAPHQSDNPDLLAQPWPIVGVVVPILVAITLYKVANALLGNTKTSPAPVPQQR